jgi:hypothetical protein
VCDVRSFGKDHNFLFTLGGTGGKKRGKTCDIGRNETAVSPFVKKFTK